MIVLRPSTLTWKIGATFFRQFRSLQTTLPPFTSKTQVRDRKRGFNGPENFTPPPSIPHPKIPVQIVGGGSKFLELAVEREGEGEGGRREGGP